MSQSRPYFPNPAPQWAKPTAAIDTAPKTIVDNTAAPGPFKATIIAFCCNYCAYAAADLAGSRRMQYPAEVRVIHVPCTGKVEPEHILGAFEKGADGVLIAGCLEGGCHFLEGNLRAKKRSNHIRKTLDEIGLGADRLLMVNLSAAMAPTFVERVNEIVETVHRMGPSPLNKNYPASATAESTPAEKKA